MDGILPSVMLSSLVMLGCEAVAFTATKDVTNVAAIIYTKSYSYPIGAMVCWANNSYEIDTSQKPCV